MGIKRANEETNDVSEKKSKVETQFSMDLFLRNFQDPESRFLGKKKIFRLFIELKMCVCI